jgi:hypothetical protein
MYNPAITVSLFLIVSLIFSVLAINATTLFINKKAQGYEYNDNNYKNYYDDNSKYYSKYPTKVNKYECQKNLFGDFLSCVEFCKANANGTGTKSSSDPPWQTRPHGIQGSLGLIGPQGSSDVNRILVAISPQGLQGPLGSTGSVNTSNIYVVWSDPTRDKSFDIFFTASNDNGQTFSTPINLSNNNGTSFGPQIISSTIS